MEVEVLMNTTLNPSFRPLWGIAQFLLSSVAALVASLLAGFVLQPLNPFTGPEHPEFMRLLVGSSFVLGPALLFLVSGTRLSGWKLWSLSLVVYIGSAQVLAHIETVAFNFLFDFGPAELLYVMLNPAVAALVLVPLIITIAGRWKTAEVLDRLGDWLPPTRSFWIRTAVASALWYLPYMLAGYVIADPITHGYYAAKMDDLASINAWIPLVQLGRGFLWTLLFVLAIRLMNRPLAEAGLIAGLLFGVFHAAGLLLPSDFMPNEMRLSHLPEIVASLVWQGCLTAALFGWRKRTDKN